MNSCYLKLNCQIANTGFQLVVVGLLLISALIVSILFIQTNYYGPWYLVKPGILVAFAEESGRLPIRPYDQAEHWYELGANAHSLRWAKTLIFLALRYVAPLDDIWVASAPFGIAIFLICLLYACAGFPSTTRGSWKWVYILSALFYLVNYPIFTWVYHSGGWPGTSLVLLSIGTAARLTNKDGMRPGMLLLLVTFSVLTFRVYHAAMAMLIAIFTVTLTYAVITSRLFIDSEAGKRSRGVFFCSAALTLGLLYVDPLGLFLGGTGLLAPTASIMHFIQTILRRGDTFPFQVGYSDEGRVALMAPLAIALAVASWLWIRNQALRLFRGEALEPADVLIGGLFLSVPVLGVMTILIGGEFRFAEAGFVLCVAMPLLAGRSSFFAIREGNATRGALRVGLLVVSTVIMLAVSFLLVLREPITRYAYVKASDLSLVRWVVARVDEPVFADVLLTALIIRQNHTARVISPGGVPEEMDRLGRVMHAGVGALARELKRRGASIAAFSARNFEAEGSEGKGRAVLTASYHMRPLPKYDFNQPYLERLYDDGSGIVVALGRGR